MGRHCSASTIRLLLAVAALFVVSHPVRANVKLTSVLARTGGAFEWEPILHIGVIDTPDERVQFMVGSKSAIVNSRKVINIGPVTLGPGGDVDFSDGGAATIAAVLKPHQTTSVPMVTAIVIDPGHGGKDPGTIRHPFLKQPHPLMEKNIVLKIGLDLYAMLRKRYPDLDVVTTRHTDTFISLAKRTEIANSIPVGRHDSKIFVSIHANASLSPSAHGYEVWYLPPSYSRNVIDARSLSRGAASVLPILNTMREEEYTLQSQLLGKDILAGLGQTVGDYETNRGLKAQDWFVVRNSKMPAVLVEVGFVTNDKEAKLLREDSYLQKLADGIFSGIEKFVDNFAKPLTPLAARPQS